ncbi:MAG: hypothetical protein HY652_05015 [Acidobacteria bacterium]|nr:hypothetical protein [Acidobacteriota bacterium]
MKRGRWLCLTILAAGTLLAVGAKGAQDIRTVRLTADLKTNPAIGFL